MIILNDLVRILHDDNDLLVIHRPATQRRGISYTLIGVGIVLGLVLPLRFMVGPIWPVSRDEELNALDCVLLGVLLASMGVFVLYFATDIDFHFRRKEMDLLVRKAGNERSIPLDRIQNAAVECADEGGYTLRLTLRVPGDDMILACSIQERDSQLRLLAIGERINHFLDVATREARTRPPAPRGPRVGCGWKPLDEFLMGPGGVVVFVVILCSLLALAVTIFVEHGWPRFE